MVCQACASATMATPRQRRRLRASSQYKLCSKQKVCRHRKSSADGGECVLQSLKKELAVVWIMYMRFARRAKGLKPARAIFAKARQNKFASWEVYEAAGECRLGMVGNWTSVADECAVALMESLLEEVGCCTEDLCCWGSQVWGRCRFRCEALGFPHFH